MDGHPRLARRSFLAAAAALAAGGSVRPQDGPPSRDYKLVWSDEFDGDRLDPAKWDYRGLGRRRKAVNVREAVRLEGQGHLLLTTSRVGEEYHTGMNGTQGKFETVCGYFECRARFQSQPGHWSAFWLQSPTLGKVVGDPKASGAEIDIEVDSWGGDIRDARLPDGCAFDYVRVYQRP